VLGTRHRVQCFDQFNFATSVAYSHTHFTLFVMSRQSSPPTENITGETAETAKATEPDFEDRPAVPQVPYTAAPTASQVLHQNQAYCTLVTSNEYAPGALVLANALLQHGTTRILACMVTPGLDADVVRRLHSVFHHLHFVDPLDSLDVNALALLGRPELGITLTKLQLWRLTQYDKLVFLDADTFPLRNVDELFEREEFSAAPDIGWPDCFNSGVFVCRPSLRTYRAIMRTMETQGSFDGKYDMRV
jgi:alpha-N-acetylglucosamine transferase